MDQPFAALALHTDENRQRRIIFAVHPFTAEHGIGSVVEFPQVSQNRVALLIAVFLAIIERKRHQSAFFEQLQSRINSRQ